jgi:uncharacterized protein involved in response to NO
VESEQSFASPAGPTWRAEPFRVFFPLGVLLGWVGIGHWLLYWSGWSETYSCMSHGLVQVQGFLMAFALGFLLTAVPRRTRSAPPSVLEMVLAAGLLIAITLGLHGHRFAIAEIGYLLLFALLLQFAIRRFVGAGAGRRPPAAFVLIPIGILHGIAGGICLLAGLAADAGAGATSLGALLVEQGVFLCFATGVGGLILPLLSGKPPPADIGSTPAERLRAVAYAAAGLAIAASFALEAVGYERAAPLARAAIVAVALGIGAGAWRRPDKPGFHRRLVWLSVWLMPLGLAASGLFPDYRVPALHVLFIGGFGLMAFGVATHVVLAHLDLQKLALGRPPAIVATAAAIILAMLARVAADWSNSYFDHLAWAAFMWIAGTLVWLLFVGSRLLARRGGADHVA